MHRHRRVPLLTLPLVLISCSLPRAAAPNPDDRVVTAEEIQRSGASNAWEALRRTLRGIRVDSDRQGRPVGLSRRGASSMLLEDRPSVFLDGVRLGDVSQLHQLPANDIARIRFVSGIDGSTHYGTNSGDGVILIYTRGGAPESP